ncbi:hypothetical protein [Shewanella sp. Isolate11]|uniref:hypothetical protein n=1 Tax=Shewanella sp. Isolate11 TaxID=2908530 RepID=UPI001EFECF62|nr:hypothetical protein [Shewanella sp. Isolate11]MCG9697966.1 hypothetical protein [Shewanella sp. Isolate11]
MALSRRKWNNIIILASVSMVAILTFLDNHTPNIPEQAQPLFDKAAPLYQLQYNDLWLSQGGFSWHCEASVLNCDEWGEAWSNILVSPIEKLIPPESTPHELVIQIELVATPQLWLMYPQQGLLKSPAGNWYQIPPSLRGALDPILDAKQNNE